MPRRQANVRSPNDSSGGIHGGADRELLAGATGPGRWGASWASRPLAPRRGERGPPRRRSRAGRLAPVQQAPRARPWPRGCSRRPGPARPPSRGRELERRRDQPPPFAAPDRCVHGTGGAPAPAPARGTRPAGRARVPRGLGTWGHRAGGAARPGTLLRPRGSAGAPGLRTGTRRARPASNKLAVTARTPERELCPSPRGSPVHPGPHSRVPQGAGKQKACGAMFPAGVGGGGVSPVPAPRLAAAPLATNPAQGSGATGPRSPGEGGRDEGKLENKLTSLTLCLRSRTPDTPPKVFRGFLLIFFFNAPRQTQAGSLRGEQQEGKDPSKPCHFPHDRGVWQTPGAAAQYLLPQRTQGCSGLRAERARDRPPPTAPAAGPARRRRRPPPGIQQQEHGGNKSRAFTLLQ